MRKTVLLLAAVTTALLLWLLAGCVKQEARQRESSGSGRSTELTRDGTTPRVHVDLAANFELDVDAEGKMVLSFDGDIWTMNADGSDLTQLTDTAEFWERDPTWSPDGKKIAFSSIEYMESDTGALMALIYVMNADGSGVPKRLTAVPDTREEHSTPAWSPDGTKIAFVSDVGGIYVINATSQESGANQPRSLNASGSLSARPWSPDGTEIAFVEYGYGTSDIYKINVSTLKKTRVTKGPGGEGPPSWSPDGTKVAFLRNGQIYVMNADGSDPTPVSEPIVEATVAATAVALDWQPLPNTGGHSLVSALALAAALALMASGAVALGLVLRDGASK